MATITIFASSLFIATCLIFIKSIELHWGNKNPLLKLLSKFEGRAETLISSLKFRVLQLVQSVRYILFVQSRVYFRSIIEKILQKMADEYKKRQDELMGRKDIINKGAVSFYLKKITEEKAREHLGERGRIEEELV